MQKVKLVLVLLIVLPALLHANPVDGTPVTKFSELVFDGNNNWTMEIKFPFPNTSSIDSIIFATSNFQSKLFPNYTDETSIYVITSDSLSIPLNINRQGDKINIYTYSDEFVNSVREDSIIFGNHIEATVGAPINNYSLMRNTWRFYGDDLTIDCLTLNSSLGVANDTTGLTATLKGIIYDTENNPVKGMKMFPASSVYFILEAPVELDTNGNYTTKIFNTIHHPGRLTVRLSDFYGWSKTQEINSFELNDIQPGSTIYQDIYLMSNEYVVTSVEDYELPSNYEITLINYPNPFNSSTNFYVKIPDNLMNKSKVINIYSATGELIKNIHLKDNTTIQWDGTDSSGRVMPSGVYYYQLNVDRRLLKSGSMILLK